MTYQEYAEKVSALRKQCEKECEALRHQYAAERNVVKIGDTVTDTLGYTITVDKLVLSKVSCPGHCEPCYDYYGRLHTKTGKLRADGKCFHIELEYMKAINGKNIKE